MGLAALASNEVGGALVQLQSEWKLETARMLEGGPYAMIVGIYIRGTLSTTAAALGAGNFAVYNDIFWQFLAYADGGLPQMTRIYFAGDMTKTEYNYWVSVNTEAWFGNKKLFEHEQKDILQPYFDKLPTPAAEAAAQNPTRLFPGATRFGAVGTNIAVLKDRWDQWIVKRLWPEWKKYSTKAANQNWIQTRMKLLANPKR